MTRVSIIDYGAGNLFSMRNALLKTRVQVEIVSNKYEVSSSDCLVLPGVGNFGSAVKNLQPIANDIIESVDSGTPILGSCLGMQLMFEVSEEDEGEGLGLLKGLVKGFKGGLKIPHMGWNTIVAKRSSPLLEDIPDGSYFYFVHSYYPDPTDKKDILALTCYGYEFASIVERENIFGCQFHPEKSGKSGALLLSNYIRNVRK
jgi:glutamine amidotransferase